MLVLTRERGQTVVIGDEISVTVIQIDDRTIKLGIDAPREISVHREEIYKRIKQEAS